MEKSEKQQNSNKKERKIPGHHAPNQADPRPRGDQSRPGMQRRTPAPPILRPDRQGAGRARHQGTGPRPLGPSLAPRRRNATAPPPPHAGMARGSGSLTLPRLCVGRRPHPSRPLTSIHWLGGSLRHSVATRFRGGHPALLLAQDATGEPQLGSQ